MNIILGIDPGSRLTGYGVVRQVGMKFEYVASGCIRLTTTDLLPERLLDIFNGVSEIISQTQPTIFAIEQVFMAKSAGSALKLGQARGAAIVAGAALDLPVAEYEARKVKQSVVGNGAADKKQVQHMIKILLGLTSAPQEDAADALAVAITHLNTKRYD